jgi:hypothetical protein
MTPLREAVLIPSAFLTVTLLGGLRVGDQVRLLAPSLTALVLAMVLLGTLARGGVLLPHVLLHSRRTPLENVSGLVVLLTLFAASAQAINLVIPERGLLHAAFAVFLFGQLLTMNAAGTDRHGTLRGMTVLLGSAFALRYIVIEALYAPESGLLHRVLTALMSGATLGGIAYDANAAVTGYVAFFTLMTYLVGLILLPARDSGTSLVRRSPPDTALTTTVALVLVLGVSGCRGAEEAPRPSAPAATPPASGSTADNLVTPDQREAALRAAQVWTPPATPVSQVNLRVNVGGDGAFKESDEIECRLVVKAMGGTTPKFDCERPGNDVVRVKYGRGNPELHAEVAASRLLSALGFGADRMYVVKRVRCAGCPALPFQALRCLEETRLERPCFPTGIDYSHVTDFDHAVVERRMEGRRLQATADQGWAWFEIDRIDQAAGGSPREHVDALKLMAIVIAHWDNKAENQRLLCRPGSDLPDGGCARPFAILQDLGASFGPTKLDLHNWRATPVWAEPRTCRVSMKQLPFKGGTFPEQQISEAGRQFLLKLLDQLSSSQLQDLFAGARVELSEGITAESRNAAAWAAAFQDKVRQIREAGPCS